MVIHLFVCSRTSLAVDDHFQCKVTTSNYVFLSDVIDPLAIIVRSIKDVLDIERMGNY